MKRIPFLKDFGINYRSILQILQNHHTFVSQQQILIPAMTYILHILLHINPLSSFGLLQ